MAPYLSLDIIMMIGERSVDSYTINVMLSSGGASSKSRKVQVEYSPSPPQSLFRVCKAFSQGLRLGLHDGFNGHMRITASASARLRRFTKSRYPWTEEVQEAEILGRMDCASVQRLDFRLFPVIERITIWPDPEQWITRTELASEDISIDLFRCATGSEATSFFNELRSPVGKFDRLTRVLGRGAQIILVRELKTERATIHRTWHKVSSDKAELLSAKTIHLLPWKHMG